MICIRRAVSITVQALSRRSFGIFVKFNAICVTTSIGFVMIRKTASGTIRFRSVAGGNANLAGMALPAVARGCVPWAAVDFIEGFVAG
jgi:hypothetical protein